MVYSLITLHGHYKIITRSNFKDWFIKLYLYVYYRCNHMSYNVRKTASIKMM